VKRAFNFDFEDESPDGKISLDYGPEDDEVLRFGIQDGEAFISANRAACLTMAKLFLKLAMGSYGEGFHVHIGEDFSSAEAQPTLCVALLGDDPPRSTH
jgi:hypothetical protein